MKYKNYTAKIEYDAADNIFIGRVVGIKDVVSFHGESIADLHNAFHESVDDYLTMCEELGQEPNKAYSGKLLLRLPADVHASIAAAAEARGTSINKWAAEVLREACL